MPFSRRKLSASEILRRIPSAPESPSPALLISEANSDLSFRIVELNSRSAEFTDADCFFESRTISAPPKRRSNSSNADEERARYASLADSGSPDFNTALRNPDSDFLTAVRSVGRKFGKKIPVSIRRERLSSLRFSENMFWGVSRFALSYRCAGFCNATCVRVRSHVRTRRRKNVVFPEKPV